MAAAKVSPNVVHVDNAVAFADTGPNGEKTSFDDVEWKTRPGRLKGPTVINFCIAFKKWEVSNTNGKEILTWEGTIEMYWFDERLVRYPEAFGMPETIWKPKPTGAKGFNLGVAESGKQIPKFGKTPDGLSDGSINLKVNFFLGDGGVNLSDQLQRFKAFPFDSVRMDKYIMFFNPCKEGDSLPYFDMRFERPNLPNRLADGAYQHVDWIATRHSDDYDMVNFAYAIAKNPMEKFGNPAGGVPCLCLTLQISRASSFYVHKGIIPLYLVSIFGCLTFAIESLDLPARISVLSALFLTVYAIQWVTIERLPRLPFNTILDHVAQNVVGSLIFLVMGACLSYRLARPVDGCDLGCLEFDLEVADMVDYITLGLVVAYLFFYSFLFSTLRGAWKISRASGWSRRWGQGKALGNTTFVVEEGKAWQLQTTEEWFEKHENKFMGEGTLVEAATW